MKITGFRDLTFLADGQNGEGYSASLPPNFAGMPSVVPQVIGRIGATPTFGPPEIGEMVVPVEFLYHGTLLTYEQAFSLLFRRLDVFNLLPGQLRAQMNDGTNVWTWAMPRVQPFASFDEGDVNSRSVDFVSCDGWQALAASSASGTF
jgi:hypothetical protein